MTCIFFIPTSNTVFNDFPNRVDHKRFWPTLELITPYSAVIFIIIIIYIFLLSSGLLSSRYNSGVLAASIYRFTLEQITRVSHQELNIIPTHQGSFSCHTRFFFFLFFMCVISHCSPPLVTLATETQTLRRQLEKKKRSLFVDLFYVVTHWVAFQSHSQRLSNDVIIFCFIIHV